MDMTTLRAEQHEDGVLAVMLDRPDVRNALNTRMGEELRHLFVPLTFQAGDLRCIVITGSGDKAFCAGGDLRERHGMTEAAWQAQHAVFEEAYYAIMGSLVPVIAAVNGAAVGWGMDLALMCDIRIASERAKFGELFIKRGLVADLGGLWRLPGVVGPAKAAELLFTGDIIDAAEAERIGLVTKVVPAEELLPEAMAMAGKIAANPPIAMRYMKEGLRKSVHADMDEMGAYIGSSLAYLFTTEDHLEGALSFVERREPEFKGR